MGIISILSHTLTCRQANTQDEGQVTSVVCAFRQFHIADTIQVIDVSEDHGPTRASVFVVDCGSVFRRDRGHREPPCFC
jgi:hypothetical protein